MTDPNNQRLQQVIAAYGHDAKRWPKSEREALSLVLQQSSDLQAELLAAKAIDSALDQYTVTTNPSIEALMKRLPAKNQPKKQNMVHRVCLSISHGFWPAGGYQLWPAIALAVAPLTLGFYLGGELQQSSDDWWYLEQQAFAVALEETDYDNN